jgi:hypothetical protein
LLHGWGSAETSCHDFQFLSVKTKKYDRDHFKSLEEAGEESFPPRNEKKVAWCAIVSASIVYRQPRKQHPMETLVGQYVPCNDVSLSDLVGLRRNFQVDSSIGENTWGCKELSFVTLERECADIGIQQVS